MPITSFDVLPDHGRLWVFPSSRDLTDSESEALLRDVDDFLTQWAAHGVPLQAARELVEQRFLLIGVDVDAERPSGCSIDALVHRLRAFGEDQDVRLIDHSSIWYRDETGIESASRVEFRKLAADGAVTPHTHVFDTSLTRVDQVRRGDLEKSAEQTWHGRAFFSELAAS
jgi:hypothetical protein